MQPFAFCKKYLTKLLRKHTVTDDQCTKEKTKAENNIPGVWMSCLDGLGEEDVDAPSCYVFWYFGYLQNHKPIELAILNLNHEKGILIESHIDPDGLYISVFFSKEKQQEAKNVCKQITSLIKQLHAT